MCADILWMVPEVEWLDSALEEVVSQVPEVVAIKVTWNDNEHWYTVNFKYDIFGKFYLIDLYLPYEVFTSIEYSGILTEDMIRKLKWEINSLKRIVDKK